MKSIFLKKWISALIFSGVGVFTVLFFAPSEVYLGNPADFDFSISIAMPVLLFLSLGVTVIFSLAVSFLPIKILKILNLSVFALTVCFYVQSLFLNGSLIVLDGEELSLSATTILINAVVWAVIVAAAFVLWRVFKGKGKERAYITGTKYLSLALALMQLVGVFSLYIGYDKSIGESKARYFTKEDRLTLSKQNNVVMFIIDYCDTNIVNEALEQDPTLFEDMGGFTYYADNIFTHGRSYPAITYLLTKQKCNYDTPYQIHVDNAFKTSDYIKTIDSLDTDIRVFTNSVYAGESAMDYVDNYTSSFSAGLSSIKAWDFIKQTAKVSAFRGMPYLFKTRFSYNTDVLNTKVCAEKVNAATPLDDLGFFENIKNSGIKVSEDYSSAFRFYHMYGSHPGATVNENAEYAASVGLAQALRGDIKIIKTYIEELKKAGVYDNTTVIITADHGEFYGELRQAQNCIMMIKSAKADTTAPLKISDSPVSHEDVFPFIIKMLGGDYSKFGTPIDEVPETAQRKRYHYNTEIDKNQKETFLREYVIEGDGRDINNYKPTGNVKKIDYTL